MANASKASEAPEVSFLGSFVQRLLFTRRERLVHHSQQQQQHDEEYEVGSNRRLSSPTPEPEPIEDIVGHSSATTSTTDNDDNEGNVDGGQNIYGNIRSTSENIVKKEEEQEEDGEYYQDVSDVMEFSEDEDVKEEDDEDFEDAMDVDHHGTSGPEVSSGHTTDDNASEEVEKGQQQARNNEVNNSTTLVIAPEQNGSVNGADICADNGSGPEDNQTRPEDQHSSTDVDGTTAITCVNNLEHNEQQGSGAEMIIPNPNKPEITGSSGNSADNSSGHQDSEDIPEDHHSSTVDGTFTIPDPNKEGNGGWCSELIMPNHNEDKPATGSEDIADNNGPDGEEEEDSGEEIEISPDEPSSQLSVMFEASLGLPLFNSCRQNDNDNSALPGDQSDGTFYSCENNASIGGDQSLHNTPNSDVYYSCEENNSGAPNRNLINIDQLLAQAQAAQSSPTLTDESIVVQPDIYSEEEAGRSSVELSEDSVRQLYNDYYKPQSLNGARLDSSDHPRGSNININNRSTSASPIINDKSSNSSRPSSSSASSTTIILGQEVGQNVATEQPSLPSEGGDEDDDDEPRAKVRKPNKRGMRRPGESEEAYEKRMKLNDYMRNYQRNKKLAMAAQAHNAGGRKA